MEPKTYLSDDLRPEYHLDYSKVTRGKCYKRILKKGANVLVLEPHPGDRGYPAGVLTGKP